MTESPVVNEWKAEGRAEGAIKTRRADVLHLMNLKFPGQVSEAWIEAVEAESDLDDLARWIDGLWISSSPEDFRSASGIGRRD